MGKGICREGKPLLLSHSYPKHPTLPCLWGLIRRLTAAASLLPFKEMADCHLTFCQGLLARLPPLWVQHHQPYRAGNPEALNLRHLTGFLHNT